MDGAFSGANIQSYKNQFDSRTEPLISVHIGTLHHSYTSLLGLDKKVE
ncbi:hypothetical protein SAMN05660420_03385 [Desulfuromusa kysingii]|uniref:Uncharacterized protein n=1 Tax=Desulfuromusa kysingii TaxID=37625 RepID=A0A1H4EH79_9BACT|nr:hypothetical protein SAMN05660420_03385 [Desulfuromusa kysingii]